MRILVVEDEPRVASFIAAGLEGAGYATEVVRTGAEAVERILDTTIENIQHFAAGTPTNLVSVK